MEHIGFIYLQCLQDFYRSEQHNRLQLVPDTVDQWVEGVQQRLMGFQEEALRVLSVSSDGRVHTHR